MPSAAGVRPRAAFLHISKCAGSSVFDALLDATGRPHQPDQQFDTCYLAGFSQPELLAPAARAAVAWDDRPTGVGDHVFFNHWSLPTLQRYFRPADIATALREPMVRVLSYVEFARSLPPHLHRAWHPDPLPMQICRSSLVEVLRLEPAGRAVDNLITRQVLWGDPLLPVGGFIDDAVAPALAADAIAALTALGAVGVVEDMPGVWRSLSEWLGAEVAPAHRNRTPARQVPGLLRTARDLATATELLRSRTRADTIVWQHFARLANIADPDNLADELVARRLDQLCTSAFFAGFHRGAAEAAAEPTALGSAWDTALADAVHVLSIDLSAADVPARPSGGSFTFVTSPDTRPADVAADVVVTLVDRELVNLRDTLTGREFDVAIVGPAWAGRSRGADVFAQLAELLAPRARLLLAVDNPTAADLAAAAAASSGWRSTARQEVAGYTLQTFSSRDTANGEQAETQVTHYGLPILFGNPGDSRAVVLELCADGHCILELGSSEGLMTRAMQERGQQVTAVEFDPVAAASAAAFSEQMLVVDLDRADSLAVLRGQQFDTILAADVLEHLRDPLACLQRAITLLAPGGRVIVSIPNAAHADVRMALLDGNLPYAEMGLLDRTHIHLFTYDSLLAMLDACGLVVVGWHRTERAPTMADVPFAGDLAPAAHHWFDDDVNATTFQWILDCRRAVDGAEAAPDPAQRTTPRRYVNGALPLGIKGSTRSLAIALRRRVFRRTAKRLPRR